MNADMTLARNELYSQMDADKPFAAYKKTILGKVAVTVWDNFTQKPIDVILQGNPRSNDESSIVKVFSEKENAFFKKANARHFNKGLIIPFTLPEEVVKEASIEQSSDEDLVKIVNMKWLGLVNKLNEIESVVVLSRMKLIAEDEEKSAKVIALIEKRISELQAPPASANSAQEEE